jgi:hypothetical protein
VRYQSHGGVDWSVPSGRAAPEQGGWEALSHAHEHYCLANILDDSLESITSPSSLLLSLSQRGMESPLCKNASHQAFTHATSYAQRGHTMDCPIGRVSRQKAGWGARANRSLEGMEAPTRSRRGLEFSHGAADLWVIVRWGGGREGRPSLPPDRGAGQYMVRYCDTPGTERRETTGNTNMT